MGEESTERAATVDEINAMKTLMREAMEAGAIGFGTSVSVSHNGSPVSRCPAGRRPSRRWMRWCRSSAT